MAKICVASHHGSLGELRNDSEFIEIGRRNDCLVELRLDQYSDLSSANLESTLHAFLPAHLLVTHRSPEEGGRNANADDAQRFFYLSQATTQGAAFIDVELATIRRAPENWRMLQAARLHGTQFVVSFHDFKRCPSLKQLRDLRREAETAGADVVKFAISAPTIFDSKPLLELLCETGWQKPFLGLAMGEAGLWSRVLGPRFPTPAPFTFARGCLAPGTAPGQPTWRELTDRYRFPQIQPDWPVYGVAGDPVAHSVLPALYNAALIEGHMPGVFLPFRVTGDTTVFVREFSTRLGLRGLCVTSPQDLSATKQVKSVLLNDPKADPEAKAVAHARETGSPSAISIILEKGYDRLPTATPDGQAVFVQQEAERFQRFTGQPASQAAMRQVLQAELVRRTGGALG